MFQTVGNPQGFDPGVAEATCASSTSRLRNTMSRVLGSRSPCLTPTETFIGLAAIASPSADRESSNECHSRFPSRPMAGSVTPATATEAARAAARRRMGPSRTELFLGGWMGFLLDTPSVLSVVPNPIAQGAAVAGTRRRDEVRFEERLRNHAT